MRGAVGKLPVATSLLARAVVERAEDLLVVVVSLPLHLCLHIFRPLLAVGLDPTVSTPGLTDGGSRTTISGKGGDKVTTIKSGPFAGRTSGGGTREQIYGTSYYGSGYPGLSGLGVANRGFPFNFYPVVWYPVSPYYPPYIHATNEYGNPDNTSRPGGVMTTVAFQNLNRTSTFHFMADNATVVAVTSQILTHCGGDINDNATFAPLPYTANSSTPLPEQAIQYYRSSSAVLSEDGYNNFALYASNPNASTPPLPPSTDLVLLSCLNSTIGSTIPLV
ncbi:hypothetical protein K488DRAFT_58261, partial [Vararia minispora EC-137]